MTARKGAGPEAAATDLEARKNVGNENARSSKPKPQNPQAAPKSWREVLPIHPAAELFPRMNADELRASIKNLKMAPVHQGRRRHLSMYANNTHSDDFNIRIARGLRCPHCGVVLSPHAVERRESGAGE